MRMEELNIEPQPGVTFGMAGFILGAVALVLVLVQFFGGPFAPTPSIGETIGQIAADMRMSAWNKLSGSGDAPVAVAATWDIDRYMIVGSMVLAVLALVLGVAGYIREEARRPVKAALSFGVAAIVFQFFATALLMIVGVILLIGIMANLNEIIGGFLEG